MKTRSDFVTNSSSSSFIITNRSGKTLTSEEVMRKLFEKIIEDSKDRFTLKPGESITVECGYHLDDGYFESFIHHEFSGWSMEELFNNEDVTVEFNESHH